MYKSICVFCASVFPYLFTLYGDFVFDDSEAIIKNKDVISDSWVNAFYNDYWGTSIKSNLSHKSYRPLTILTFRINYFLNEKKLEAVHFKVTNLIFHTTCCFLVWRVFKTILKDLCMRQGRKWWNDIAFVASVLFAVHPVHVEAVSGAVGRADLLAANTFFLAFIFYSKAVKLTSNNYAYLHYFTAIVLAGASMLFKENGITVLGFCICYDIITLKKNKKSANANSGKKYLAIRISVVIMAIICLLYGRWLIMGGEKPVFKSIYNPAAFSKSLFTKIATYNYIYFLNLLLLIWPQWLCYDWSMACVPLIETILDFRIFAILLMYFYGLCVFAKLWRKTKKASLKRLLLLSILLAIIPFLPASNIFYPVGFVLAERILYISSAGYCLFIAIGFRKLTRYFKGTMYKISISMFCLLILIFGIRSWQRSEEWRSEFTLFASGLLVCPLNAKVHYNVAKVADDVLHNTTWALEEYKEAIRLYPDYHQAMNNLANLLRNQKKYEEAEYFLRNAIGLKRDVPAAWMNLGIVLASVKRYEESEKAYKTALEYRTVYPDCVYNLGNLYLEWKKTKEAMESWMQAVNLNSTHVLAWTNLLALLDNTGQLETALEIIPKALKVLPESPSINFAAANVYGKKERYEEAEILFKKAITLFDSKVQAIHYANLGVLYHRWKKYHLAADMYRNALKIDPSFSSALKNLESVQKKIKN